jgi:hypothetical protein
MAAGFVLVDNSESWVRKPYARAIREYLRLLTAQDSEDVETGDAAGG